MIVSLPNAHLKHLKQSDTSNTPRYLKRLSNAIMLQPSNDNDKITFFEWDVKKIESINHITIFQINVMSYYLILRLAKPLNNILTLKVK